MKIVIIFPKQFFTREQLNKLAKFQLKFVEDHNVDLEKLNSLYQPGDLILAIDPTYVKDGWNSLPLKRLKKMSGLKALCLTTTSYSWVDVEKLAAINIIVTNTPGKSTNAVAEFNIFLMYSLLRKLPLVAKNNWQMDYHKFLNQEATGAVAGVVGLGQIGNKVAHLCQAIGMKICYWNRSKKKSQFKSVSLKQLFKTADAIFTTIATPNELTGFINKNLIKSVKQTAVIVSTSDSNIFEEKFLLDQVAKNRLAGYAFENSEKTLHDYKGNVMVFPEQAYYTSGTLKNTARILTHTILSVIKGKPLNQVN